MRKDALWLRRKVLDQIFEDARLEFNALRSRESELLERLGPVGEEFKKESAFPSNELLKHAAGELPRPHLRTSYGMQTVLWCTKNVALMRCGAAQVARIGWRWILLVT